MYALEPRGQHPDCVISPQVFLRCGRLQMTLAGEPRVPSRADLDDLLLAVAQRRDREAFVSLFKHFAPRLKTFLIKSGLTAGTAEELAQETMISVWRKASYFDPGRAAAATWIFAIARNLRIDHLRHVRVAEAADVDPYPFPNDDVPTGERILLAAERDGRVRTALAGLTSEQALIVRMSFFHDKAHGEIARELGIPLGTVKSRVRLALQRLRTLLGGEP